VGTSPYVLSQLQNRKLLKVSFNINHHNSCNYITYWFIVSNATKSSALSFLQEDIAWNKENVVHDEDSEWLSRNDIYKRQSIHMPSQMQESLIAGMNANNF
jgi:hypothetical protein